MTYTKKFTIYLLLCTLFINSDIVAYPVLGEFNKSADGHNVLILVDKNSHIDSQTEKQSKTNTIPSFRKILSDNEINLILEDRLDVILSNIRKNINIWNAEFEADPQWNSIIEQNYSNLTPSNIVYKKMTLDPKATTKLFVLLSKVKNYIDNLPLKEHLGFTQKIGANKDNNFFKSCQSAKDYFRLDRSNKATATVTLADWRTPNIVTITTNYKNGLETLSQDLYLIDKESWPNFIEDLARAFLPQNTSATEFCPIDTLKTKDLLNDIEVILKKLEQLESATSIDAEKELWSSFRVRIQTAKEYILNAVSIFKNLSQEDKNSFQQLFKEMPKYHYAQLHWFAIVYAYILKDKNQANNIFPDGNHDWVKILTEDLLYIGLMDAILDSKIKQTKAVIYLNQESYKIISQHLLNLGYNKLLAFDNLSTGAPLTGAELEMLANQFPVNVLRIKQILQKPLMSSLTF